MAAVAALYPQFQAANTEVWGISTDSIAAHKVFKDVSPSAKQVQYPLLSDRNQLISRAYRVLDVNSGATYRSTVIVDPEGVIVSKMIYPREVGRNVPEILRMIYGLQYGRATGEGVPANWLPGQPGIKRDPSKYGTV